MNTPIRRRKPRTTNPRTDRRMANFTASEGRRLSSWMKRNGVETDTQALVRIVMQRLDAEGIQDPGPDAAAAQPHEQLACA